MKDNKTRKLRYLLLAVALVMILVLSHQRVAGDINDFMSLNVSTNCIAPLVILENGTDQKSIVYSNGTSAKISIDANSTSLTYNYSLNIVNNRTSTWETILECYNYTDISRVNSTIILHNNSTSSQQISISGGNMNQTNNYYALEGNSKIHVGVTNLIENSPTGNTVLRVYLRIKTPSITTYTLYVITFEFT